MPTFSVYKDIQPTYKELLPILEQLGFQKSIVEVPNVFGVKIPVYRLENAVEKSVITLAHKPDNALIAKASFAECCIQLYWRGIIEDMQDMAKMIERNRLAAGVQIN